MIYDSFKVARITKESIEILCRKYFEIPEDDVCIGMGFEPDKDCLEVIFGNDKCIEGTLVEEAKLKEKVQGGIKMSEDDYLNIFCKALDNMWKPSKEKNNIFFDCSNNKLMISKNGKTFTKLI